MDLFDEVIGQAEELVEAIEALRKHKKDCNRCFQGIFCPVKNRLQREIVRLGRLEVKRE